MNVNLTPKLEAMVREKVESGLYNNASEVVREALRLMEQRDTFKALRAEVLKGVEQVERGETVDYTPELLEDMRLHAIERVRGREGDRISNDIQAERAVLPVGPKRH